MTKKFKRKRDIRRLDPSCVAITTYIYIYMFVHIQTDTIILSIPIGNICVELMKIKKIISLMDGSTKII